MCWQSPRVCPSYGAGNCVASHLLSERILVDMWEFYAYAGGGRRRVAYKDKRHKLSQADP